MAWRTWAAIGVHFLTASGAVCGLLALQSTAAENWGTAFLWLGAALLIDAIDGPLARRVDVTGVLPRFDGSNLDQAVDYLNYCAVPAFLLLESPILQGAPALIAASVILLSSLFHFSDRQSKTADGYFVGFPAIWNIVVFYLFVFDFGDAGALAAVAVFAGLTVVPLKWLHPFRVQRLRPLTTGVVAAWVAAALYTVDRDFTGGAYVKAIFVMAAIYVVALGLSRTISGADR